MNRRDFLRTTGTGLAAMAWALPTPAQDIDPEEIQAGAEARINKYRKAPIILSLTDPKGNLLKPSIPIRIEQTRHKFLFGCNIFKLNRCQTEADNAAYAERFADLLNFATLPFYWWDYERNQGSPNDQRTEDVAAWCKARNITTKGHPLAWNYIQPPWLKTALPQEAMRLQLKRIARCVEKFTGAIDIWDVVNEATHYDRKFCKDNAPVLTQAITDMGVAAYVRQAFAAARKANPKATLLINDYRTDPSYENKVVTRLVDAQGKATYDVIGIQSHMHGGVWNTRKTWDVCDRYAKYNVPLHYTETTVVSGRKSEGAWKTTAKGEALQAEAVSDFYTLLFSHRAVEAITWWDFTDQNAWQGAPAGLIRADMTPKPAYDRLEDLIKGQWWTKLQRSTGPQGKVDFTGFLGDYQVSATVNGRKLTGRFTINDRKKQNIKLKLA